MKRKTKIISLIVFLFVLAITLTIYIKYFFVFGEGVKSGELNFLVYKGYVFKTYEGRLIQTGIKSRQAGTIESNEFNFSVDVKSIADSLMRCSGKMVELRYNEYLGALPWRGVQKVVVTDILSVK